MPDTGMRDAPQHHTCASCDYSGTLVCSGCKSMHYCSKACQKADWSVHKIICKIYSKFLTTAHEPDQHSAIYFHPNEPHPRFVWVPYQLFCHPSTEFLADLGVTEDRLEEEGFNEISHSVMLNRHIEPHHILLTTPVAKDLCLCCNSDLPINQSLMKINEELAIFFRGPILALGKYCQMNEFPKPGDLDLGPMAFRFVVDALRDSYCQCEDLSPFDLGERTCSVRLNCAGDKQFMERPSLESVHEPISKAKVISSIKTPIADKIGLPLVVHQLPPAVLWRDSNRPQLTKNHYARMLNPLHQHGNTGSLILQRKDGNPIVPHHVKALFAYTNHKLKYPIHPGNASLLAGGVTAEQMSGISKEDFEHWYATKWLHHNAGHVPSPFDKEYNP